MDGEGKKKGQGIHREDKQSRRLDREHIPEQFHRNPVAEVNLIGNA